MDNESPAGKDELKKVRDRMARVRQELAALLAAAPAATPVVQAKAVDDGGAGNTAGGATKGGCGMGKLPQPFE